MSGTELGEAMEAELLVEQCPTEVTSQEDSTSTAVRCVTESDLQARKKKLCEIVGKPELLTQQTEQLHLQFGS